MRQHLCDRQGRAIRRAVRWEIFTIVYTSITIAVIALVVGNSQAMRTAWIEDILSLIPQLAFLLALIFVRRRPTLKHPYGIHRAMGVGHLVAGVALLAVGINLAIEAVTGLIAAEHPTIGTVVLFGHTVWLGWLMVRVMAVVIIGPVFFYGPAKSKLAPVLHNKLLNTKAATVDLIDQRARTYDSKEPHPLAADIVAYLRGRPWIADAAVRLRDQGQIFHIEAFLVPKKRTVTLRDMTATTEGVAALDWKVQDVVIVPSEKLPDEADTGR